jgi:beta-barrel assembly-enhancing protease
MASLLGCASNKNEVQKAETDQLRQELADELEIGRQMAAKLAGHLGYDNEDPEAIRYLNLVGQNIAQQSGRTEINYRFAILKDEQVNAFATPGGYVFVTKGLLAALRSESELAGVLGHEIAHVAEKHMFNEIRPKRDVSMGETMSRMMSRGGSEIGAAIGQIVNKGLNILLETGLGPEKEQAADQAASLYTTAAGYEGTALLGLLKRLGSGQADLKVAKTHPPFDERIRSFEAFINKQGLNLRSKADEKVMASRFKSALSRYQPKGS